MGSRGLAGLGKAVVILKDVTGELNDLGGDRESQRVGGNGDLRLLVCEFPGTIVQAYLPGPILIEFGLAGKISQGFHPHRRLPHRWPAGCRSSIPDR